MSYKAKAKQLAWWPACEKRLLTDQRLPGSGGGRTRGFLTLYGKPLKESQVKWWEDGWPDAAKPDSRDVNISFYQAFLVWWRPTFLCGRGLSSLCGGDGRRSRRNFRWSSGFTQIDLNRWLDVNADFIS